MISVRDQHVGGGSIGAVVSPLTLASILIMFVLLTYQTLVLFGKINEILPMFYLLDEVRQFLKVFCSKLIK